MPLPSPSKGESQSDFVSRCADSDTMKAEFPEQHQRLAVCYSQWREARGGSPKILKSRLAARRRKKR